MSGWNTTTELYNNQRKEAAAKMKPAESSKRAPRTHTHSRKDLWPKTIRRPMDISPETEKRDPSLFY